MEAASTNNDVFWEYFVITRQWQEFSFIRQKDLDMNGIILWCVKAGPCYFDFLHYVDAICYFSDGALQRMGISLITRHFSGCWLTVWNHSRSRNKVKKLSLSTRSNYRLYTTYDRISLWTLRSFPLCTAISTQKEGRNFCDLTDK